MRQGLLPVRGAAPGVPWSTRSRPAQSDKYLAPRAQPPLDTSEATGRSPGSSAQSSVVSRSAQQQQEAASPSYGEAACFDDVCTSSRAAWVSDGDLYLQQTSSLAGWLEGVASAASWQLPWTPGYKLKHVSLPIQVNKPPAQIQQQTSRPGKDPKKREDFYANVGEAIRVLRRETPLLFQEDLTYDIYRDDITFRDPRNRFQGKKDYRTIFWSLRFHGKLFFRVLYVDVLRIWESPENVKDAGTVLKMRWSVHGIPRVPWDAEGIFDGISTFKLDSNGKIYDHMVNNVILKDPPKEGNPFLAGLNLIPLPQQQQPCPGAWFRSSRKDIKKKEDTAPRSGCGSSKSGTGIAAPGL